jgi:hypothetical protein
LPLTVHNFIFVIFRKTTILNLLFRPDKINQKDTNEEKQYNVGDWKMEDVKISEMLYADDMVITNNCQRRKNNERQSKNIQL